MINGAKREQKSSGIGGRSLYNFIGITIEKQMITHCYIYYVYVIRTNDDDDLIHFSRLEICTSERV